MFGIYEVVQKQRCQFVELHGVLCGEIAAVGVALDEAVYFRMSVEICVEAVRYQFALGDDAGAVTHSLGDLSSSRG